MQKLVSPQQSFLTKYVTFFYTFVSNTTPKTLGVGLTESEWETLCFDRGVGFSLII